MAELLTPEQVAAILGVTRARVLALARGGTLPHVRVGRDYRFPEGALNDWVAAQTSYTVAGGKAQASRQRGRVGVPGARPSKAVGRERHRGLDAGGPSDPPGALRIVRAGGEGPAR